jgi:apolipoprotein N-acyltransferase
VRILVAALSGLLVAASFVDHRADLLAWAGLAPLFAALRGRSPRAAFALGWVAGATFFAATTYWVLSVLTRYTTLPPLLAGAVFALMTAYLACYWGGFSATFAALRSSGLPHLWLAPAAWVAFEWLRGWFFIGFPWAILGTSQHRALPLVQGAEVTGVDGVSALIVLTNLVLAEIGARGRTRRTKLVAAAALGTLLAFAAIAGEWRIRALRALPAAGSLDVAIVQGNVGEERKWDPAFGNETLARYHGLTLEAAGAKPGLVVWPETAIPFFFQDPGERRSALLALANRIATPLVFGSPAWRHESGSVEQLNRAYLLSPQGDVLGSYDKIELVPFGEAVPYGNVLSFVERIVPAAHEIVPGSSATIFDLPAARFGVLICYEGIFPELTRRFVAGGADFLVNLSNDAWFGRSAALQQHLAQVALRAVENRVPIVRATNTGISALIEPDGSVRWQGPIDEALWRVETIRWPGVRTFYARFGNVFAWFCTAVTAAALVLAARRLREANSAGAAAAK